MPERGRCRFCVDAGYGCLIGAATLVPGVSGGTVAYLLGIYTRVITALAALNTGWWVALVRLDTRRLAGPDWRLLLALGIGVALAPILLVWGVGLHRWIDAWPRPFYGLFCGFILADVWLFVRGTRFCRYRASTWFGAGMVTGGLLLSGLSAPLAVHTVSWFSVGLVSLSAMLVPGISGAYLLLLFGFYGPLFNALEVFDMGVLVPFFCGGGVGVLLSVRLLHYLLQHHRKPLLFFVNGLLLISLVRIWPFVPLPEEAAAHALNSYGAACIALLVGLIFALLCYPDRHKAGGHET